MRIFYPVSTTIPESLLRLTCTSYGTTSKAISCYFVPWDCALLTLCSLTESPWLNSHLLRHSMCGQCQNYVDASISELDPAVLQRENVDVIIISNWSVPFRFLLCLPDATRISLTHRALYCLFW